MSDDEMVQVVAGELCWNHIGRMLFSGVTSYVITEIVHSTDEEVVSVTGSDPEGTSRTFDLLPNSTVQLVAE